MKFLKKVLYNLYPKILFAQILYLIVMVFYIWYCLIKNPHYQYLVIEREVLFFAINALILSALFIPKIFKIVFYQPRYNSQTSARIALFFFVFLSMFLQFISLKEIVLYTFGKTHQINNLNEIQKHPECSFFTFKENINLSDAQDAYYIYTSVSGKSKNLFHVDIYATKALKTYNQTTVVLCKMYQTDYPNTQSESEKQRLVDKDFDLAKMSFTNLTLSSTDTLKRIYKKINIEKFNSSIKLLNTISTSRVDLLLHSNTPIFSFKKKSLLIFGGISLLVNLILVLFLSTGIRFKD